MRSHPCGRRSKRAVLSGPGVCWSPYGECQDPSLLAHRKRTPPPYPRTGGQPSHPASGHSRSPRVLMAEPRYDEDEVRKILARATEVRPESSPGATDTGLPAPRPNRGLTRRELEEIGEEAGIPASRIADAVAEVDLDRSLESSEDTHLGVAFRSSHDVRIPRLLTESEWDKLVVQLREAFDTQGAVSSEGSLRSWSGGQVTVMMEPLSEGARLRFESEDGSSKSLVDGAPYSRDSGCFSARSSVLWSRSRERRCPRSCLSRCSA